MRTEKNQTFLITCITCAVLLLVCGLVKFMTAQNVSPDKIVKVGFIYDSDESTPYTANFIRAQRAVEEQYGSGVEILVKSNVSADNAEKFIRELVEAGCDIIFTSSYGYSFTAKKLAEEYPGVQFCQATGDNADDAPVLANYHTFMGHIYEGRYVAGKAAGMKLKELIDSGEISVSQAKIGYVGAFPFAEVISGYTAFFLGVRSEVPEAVMTVKYTGSWSDYAKEYSCACQLIDEGCVIISQHSDTTGPAVACEEKTEGRIVYHVGYNNSMIDVAPTTSLISTRINWVPYITAAVGAVQGGKRIESTVRAQINGNDAGAGFEKDWVVMIGFNRPIAAKGTDTMIEETIDAFRHGKVVVFQGEYTGYDPDDPSDIWDLQHAYPENEKASAPSFHYYLKDVIRIEE